MAGNSTPVPSSRSVLVGLVALLLISSVIAAMVAAGWSFGWQSGYTQGTDVATINCFKNPKFCKDLYEGIMQKRKNADDTAAKTDSR